MDSYLVPADTTDDHEHGRQPSYVATIYPPRVRELAFEVWWLVAGRNAKRTAQLLPGYLPEDAESKPDERTVRRWCRDEGWSVRARDRQRAMAPHLAEEWAEQLHGMIPLAMQVVGRILSGDPELVNQKGPTVMAQQTTALELLKMVGADQAAFVGRGKPIYAEGKAKDVADMSADEMVRYHREVVSGHADKD